MAGGGPEEAGFCPEGGDTSGSFKQGLSARVHGAARRCTIMLAALRWMNGDKERGAGGQGAGIAGSRHEAGGLKRMDRAGLCSQLAN